MILMGLIAAHVIAVVCWFAGLFYMGRLFVYDAQALAKPEPDRSILHAQLGLMQRKLWKIITWPSCVLTVLFGIAIMVMSQAYLFGWMHVKLMFVLLLLVYHVACGWIRKNLLSGTSYLNETQLRIFNEIPTVLLIGIVVTVYFKFQLNFAVWTGLIVGGVAILVGVLIRKK